ncbi:MAG: hypothetical protein AAFW70_18575 [Cyanobacteria bacterium J06635_10]
MTLGAASKARGLPMVLSRIGSRIGSRRGSTKSISSSASNSSSSHSKSSGNKFKTKPSKGESSNSRYRPERSQAESSSSRYRPERSQAESSSSRYRPERSQAESSSSRYRPERSQAESSSSRYRPERSNSSGVSSSDSVIHRNTHASRHQRLKPQLTIKTNKPKQSPQSGKNINASRRKAAGLQNPSHSHSNMRPHWEDAAYSPIPKDVKQNTAKWRQHFMSPKRHYVATSPGGTRKTVIQGHKNAVLGHKKSAAQFWNEQGHKQSRSENAAHNRQTNTYHGIEYRPWSDASGSRTPRYLAPTSERGSHPSYWDPRHPDYQGAWPTRRTKH